MTSRQQITTAFMGLLMLATIVLMPVRFPSHATHTEVIVRQSGVVTAEVRVSPELPQDEVRDLTYN